MSFTSISVEEGVLVGTTSAGIVSISFTAVPPENPGVAVSFTSISVAMSVLVGDTGDGVIVCSSGSTVGVNMRAGVTSNAVVSVGPTGSSTVGAEVGVGRAVGLLVTVAVAFDIRVGVLVL